MPLGPVSPLLDTIQNIPQALRCVVTDDDPFHREWLAQYIRQTPGLLLVGSFASGKELLTYLQSHPPEAVDILLLDVVMPGLSGLDVIAQLPSSIAVVLTTAHRDFAIEAFSLNVIDYLVKPISFKRFYQCVALFQNQRVDPLTRSSPPSASKGLFVKSLSRQTWLLYEHIQYVEAVNYFAVVVTVDRQLSTNQTLSAMSQRLPKRPFVRVHRSFLVNTRAIKEVGDVDMLLMSGRRVPIGRTYQASTRLHLATYGVSGTAPPEIEN